MIAELDRIRLRRARPAEGLAAGAEGTVVLAYPGGRDFEVEFLDDEGWTVAICTVRRDELVPIREGRRRSPTLQQRERDRRLTGGRRHGRTRSQGPSSANRKAVAGHRRQLRGMPAASRRVARHGPLPGPASARSRDGAKAPDEAT